MAIINDSFGVEFDNYDKTTLHMSRLATTEQCFKFLIKKRADFVVAGFMAGNQVLRKLNLENTVVALPKRVISTGVYVGISKRSKRVNNQKFVKQLNSALRTLVKKGYNRELLKKYKAI